MCGVACDGRRVFVTAGMSEGMPQSGAITLAGQWLWVSGPTGGWMGGIDLAVDGDTLYFLGGPHCREARLFVQEAADGTIRNLDNMKVWGTHGPKAWFVEEFDQPRRVDARDGKLILASPSTGLIVWLDPDDGREIDRLSVGGGLTDVALLGGGNVLVIRGDDVAEVARGGGPPAARITGLSSPYRIAVDRISGHVFVAEAGVSQRVKRFGADYQLQQTFGREGGRRTGVYKPGDFLDVSDIAGDGSGGFVVTETAAPRRTAHFDMTGRLVNEWYGGQGFYTTASPEPDNPKRLWMYPGGWITQVEADFQGRSWRPLANYRFDEAIDRSLFTTRQHGSRIEAKRLDLDGDGRLETYIVPKWSAPMLLKVDEAAGLLRPVAAMDAPPECFVIPAARTLRTAIGEAVVSDGWRLDAEVQWRIFHANQEGWLDVVDAADKPIVSLVMFRGDPKPGVTSQAGHANYIVFNDRELIHSGRPEWALTGRPQPVTIEIAGGRAVVTFGDPDAGEDNFVELERPLLDGAGRRPAAVRLRDIRGGRVTVEKARLTFDREGRKREVAVATDAAAWTSAAVEPAVLAQAVRLRGEDPGDVAVRRRFRGFSWADANDDGSVQADEVRLATTGGSPSVLHVDEALTVYLRSDAAGGPDHVAYPAVGRTSAGYPVWDWGTSKSGPNTAFGQTRSLWTDPVGNIYQTSAHAGDGYNHCWQWPATFVNATAVAGFAPEGTMLWQAGERAGRMPHPRGQMHYPINTLGTVHGCIGFADYVANSAEFWTEDGLYVGGLFDRRADDGLHPRVYAWWRHDRAVGDDFENNLALLQYDLLAGGNLVRRPNGDVLFCGAGWNNAPVFRVTGWDAIRRQQGRVTAPASVRAAQRMGTGLRGEYFTSAAFEGEPAVVRTDERIWMSGSRWPDDPAVARAAAVRWTGSIEPVVGGPHTFSFYTADAGARLWIGGRKIIDQWSTPGKYFAEPVDLEAGQRYAVRIDWRRRGDKPEMHLNWEALDLPIEHVPTAALYPETPAGALWLATVASTPEADGQRRYDAVLDVRHESDTLTLGIEGPVRGWELSGRVIFHVAHAENQARLEVLDEQKRPIVVWYLYRGDAPPGVPQPHGHTNYLVFNNAEVPLDDAQRRAIGTEQAFRLQVAGGVARLTHASGFTAERPTLAGDAARPVTVRVRSNADTARVRAADFALRPQARVGGTEEK
jgi:hypothetical protein